MNKNIKILVVNNNAVAKDTATGATIAATLAQLNLNKVVEVDSTKAAITEFINANQAESFDVTFICDQPDMEEIDLIESMLKINPDHYVVMLTENITPERVLSSIRSGASGVLNKPWSVDKLRMELDKYSLLREDKKEIYS